MNHSKLIAGEQACEYNWHKYDEVLHSSSLYLRYWVMDCLCPTVRRTANECNVLPMTRKARLYGPSWIIYGYRHCCFCILEWKQHNSLSITIKLERLSNVRFAHNCKYFRKSEIDITRGNIIVHFFIEK